MHFWNGKQNLDNFWIELCPSAAANFLARMRHRIGIAIRAVAQHCIESVRDGDDASPQRNLFTAQATWIARTIEELMVGEDDIGDLSQKRDAREHVVADLTVSAHDLLFGVIESPRLAKDLVGDDHFSNIVKKSCASENRQIVERNGNTFGDRNGIGADALAMAFCVLVFKGKGAAECFDGVVVSLSKKLEGLGQFFCFLLRFVHE